MKDLLPARCIRKEIEGRSEPVENKSKRHEHASKQREAKQIVRSVGHEGHFWLLVDIVDAMDRSLVSLFYGEDIGKDYADLDPDKAWTMEYSTN